MARAASSAPATSTSILPTTVAGALSVLGAAACCGLLDVLLLGLVLVLLLLLLLLLLTPLSAAELLLF
jgi:hypothetical protein